MVHIFVVVVTALRAGVYSWLLQLLGVREKKKMQSQSMTTRCHPSKKKTAEADHYWELDMLSLHRKQRLVLNCE